MGRWSSRSFRMYRRVSVSFRCLSEAHPGLPSPFWKRHCASSTEPSIDNGGGEIMTSRQFAMTIVNLPLCKG